MLQWRVCARCLRWICNKKNDSQQNNYAQDYVFLDLHPNEVYHDDVSVGSVIIIFFLCRRVGNASARSLARPLMNLGMSRATDEMVIGHANGLHERVANDRAAEFEAGYF